MRPWLLALLLLGSAGGVLAAGFGEADLDASVTTCAQRLLRDLGKNNRIPLDRATGHGATFDALVALCRENVDLQEAPVPVPGVNEKAS